MRRRTALLDRTVQLYPVAEVLPVPEIGSNRWSRPAQILVATDLSDLDRLMPFAIQQGAQTGARLVLLHVVATTELMAADATGMPYYDPAGALETAARMLEPWCQAARKRFVRCDGIVREGSPALHVIAAARQFQADRLILGTRSRGKLSKLLLGSVAEQVLRSVNIPVITVGPEAHLAVDMPQPDPVVLHATTLRETSRPGAALACQIASTLGARLVLLHVLPHLEEMRSKGLPTGLDSAAMQQLKILAEQTANGTGISVEPLVMHGHPAIEILAAAADHHASLIVMTSTKRLAFEIVTRDRTIYRVLAHARCPVMSIRESQIFEQPCDDLTAVHSAD